MTCLQCQLDTIYYQKMALYVMIGAVLIKLSVYWHEKNNIVKLIHFSIPLDCKKSVLEHKNN